MGLPQGGPVSGAACASASVAGSRGWVGVLPRYLLGMMKPCGKQGLDTGAWMSCYLIVVFCCCPKYFVVCSRSCGFTTFGCVLLLRDGSILVQDGILISVLVEEMLVFSREREVKEERETSFYFSSHLSQLSLLLLR